MNIFKRMLAFALCLVLASTAFVACKDDSGDTDAPSDGETPAITEPITPDKLPTDRKSSAFKTHDFAVGDSKTALKLMLPMDWRISGETGQRALLEDDAKIGVVCVGEVDGNMTLATDETVQGISVKTYIGKLTRSETNEPYYQVLYAFQDAKGTSCSVLVEIKQSAMDSTLMQWLNRPTTETIKGYKDIPTLSLNEGNGKTKILILGNSFVSPNHSAISAILEEVIEVGEQECEVHWYSLGYATVSKYASDTGESFAAARDRINSGEYNLVLMCGLYGSSDVRALKDIQKLCVKTGTRLVLLPAHNEGETHISNALLQYDDLPCLNWKQEIDRLISAGVSRELFCKNDAHSHSTNLGGYVGAHLIYRALFGELPPIEGYAYDSIIQPTLIAPLGDYVTEGLQLIPESEINRL